MDETVIRRAERTDKSGFGVCFKNGTIIMVKDSQMAHEIYASADAKSLFVCDGGYKIPLLSK